MKVRDLNRNQIAELKGRMLEERNEANGEGTFYSDVAEADTLISDEEVFAAYDGVDFSADDFTSSEEENDIGSIAEAYVVAYTANLPHDREEMILADYGIGWDKIRDILESYNLLREGDIEEMTEEEFEGATKAAVEAIVKLQAKGVANGKEVA